MEELEKQLEHLQRQAKAAERFNVLKQEERRLKAELLALDWKELSSAAREKIKFVSFHETRVEEGLAKLREVEANIEIQRENYTEKNEALNRVQADFYQIGSNISQLEQQIKHTRERMEALKADADKARVDEKALQRQLADDRKDLNAVMEKMLLLEPQLERAETGSNEANNALRQAEESWQNLQGEWDLLNRSLSEIDKRIEVNYDAQRNCFCQDCMIWISVGAT